MGGTGGDYSKENKKRGCLAKKSEAASFLWKIMDIG
jgi:hypothetical protein